MRRVPFGIQTRISLVVVTVAPLLPLTLTVVPLDKMIAQLIKALL
jgi:hypothetical protein